MLVGELVGKPSAAEDTSPVVAAAAGGLVFEVAEARLSEDVSVGRTWVVEAVERADGAGAVNFSPEGFAQSPSQHCQIFAVSL